MRTKYLNGQDLLDALQATGLIAMPVSGVYDAYYRPMEENIVAAQQLLLDCGWYISGTNMIHDDMYTQTYMSDKILHPYWIRLRYITDGFAHLPLMLMYHENDSDQRGCIRRFGRQTTFGTGTSEAETMLVDFRSQFGDRRPFWLPAFTESPFLTMN